MSNRVSVTVLTLCLACPGLANAAAADPVPTAVELPAPVLPAMQAEPAPDPGRIIKLSLADAAHIALAKSPRIGIKLAKYRQSLADADTAGAPLRLQEVTTLLGPPAPKSLAPVSSNLQFAPFQFQFRKIMLDGGKIESKIQQSKNQAYSDGAQAQVEWQQLNLEVTLAYIDVLRAQAQVAVSEHSLELRNTKQVEENRKRFLAGDIPKGDILQAQVPEADARLQLDKDRFAVRDKQEALTLLLGIPIDTPLELSPPPPAKALDLGIDQCTAQALKNRPDLLAGEYSIIAAQHGVEAARLDNVPRFSAVGGVIGYQNPGTIVSGYGYQAGLELSWPILDGGMAGDLTRSAKAFREQLRLKQIELERQSEREVRQAYREAEQAWDAQQSGMVQLSQAQDAYRVATAQYHAGMTHYYPVRQAALDLIKAQLVNNSAVFDYLAARAKLDHARGQEPETSLQPSPPLPALDQHPGKS